MLSGHLLSDHEVELLCGCANGNNRRRYTQPFAPSKHRWPLTTTTTKPR